MSRKRYRDLLVAFALLNLAGLPGCGRDRQLSITSIQPPIETFGATNIPVSADAGLSVQLRALGSYIQPPASRILRIKSLGPRMTHRW